MVYDDVAEYFHLPQTLPVDQRISLFRDNVLSFYSRFGRSYPWRENTSPYPVMVSEFMLQQTQTDRVAPKFVLFLERFPDLQSLARSTLADVLTAWQGLGYNRRARFLLESARILVLDFSSQVPNCTDALCTLPGIGHATASAIRAYAFDEPVVYIETNIRSVFIHHFYREEGLSVADADLLPLVEQALDRRSPRRWYSALMDYGTELKKRTVNPGRKSSSYIRQSPFKGSRRELRGMIIGHLLRDGRCTLPVLTASTGRERHDVESVIRDLVVDGMVFEEKGTYCIR